MEQINFDVDPMYMTVFFIRRYIDNHHKDIEDKYSIDAVYVPEQYTDKQRYTSSQYMDDAINKMIDSMEIIKYKDVLEYDLMKDIPNNKAKRFADYEYLHKNNLLLNGYDEDKAHELIMVYADKYNLDTVDFDDYERIGQTIWEHIHNTQEYKDIYMEQLSKGNGDTGLGVYSKSLKHFIPCEFAGHKDAIYSMLRLFDEFKDMTDSEFFRLVNFESTSKDAQSKLQRMDYLIMNDFKLVGNQYKDSKRYL